MSKVETVGSLSKAAWHGINLTVSGKTGTAEMPNNSFRCAMTSDINPLEPVGSY